MKFVQPLTGGQEAALQDVFKNGSSHRQRQRSQAVLLSAKGYTLDLLADILEADRDTISGWLDQWQQHGFDGLRDAPKPGRPSKLNAQARALIAQALKKPTPNLEAVLLPQLKKTAST